MPSPSIQASKPTSPLIPPVISPSQKPKNEAANENLQAGAHGLKDDLLTTGKGLKDKGAVAGHTAKELGQQGIEGGKKLGKKGIDTAASLKDNYLRPAGQKATGLLSKTGLTFQNKVADSHWPNRSVTLKTTAWVSGISLALWAGCHAMALGIAPLALVGISVGNLCFGVSLASALVGAATVVRRIFTVPPASGHLENAAEKLESVAKDVKQDVKASTSSLQTATP